MSDAAPTEEGSEQIPAPSVASAMDLGFRLHHVGVAVPKLAPAAATLATLFGYRLIDGPYDDPIQRVSVSFLTMSAEDRVELELVAPLTEDSPVRSILGKGGGAYHLCMETADMEAALAHTQRLGCMLVSAPAPAVAFQGRRIAWIYTPTRQLIELVESESRAPSLTAAAQP